MHRRDLLLGGGSVFVAGGLGLFYVPRQDSVRVPRGIDYDTIYRQEVTIDPDSYDYGRLRATEDGKSEVFRTRSAAVAELADTPSVTEFVDGTDFETGVLVVAEYLSSPDSWLELTRIERSDGGLTVHVTVEYERSGRDSLTTQSLLVSISGIDAPDEVPVTVTFTDPGA